MARYAQVIVDISLEKLDKTFTYGIPGELQDKLEPGMQVEIPFGSGGRMITGYVLELTDKTSFAEGKIKEIRCISKNSIRLEGQMIALAAWMRRTYGCTMNQALKTVLPVKRQVQEQKERQIQLLLSEEQAKALLTELERKSQLARFRVLAALLDCPRQEYGALLKTCQVSGSVLLKMQELGILQIETRNVARMALPRERLGKETVLLNKVQQSAVKEICSGWDANDTRPCLIHGVTGSGKTEVYMELIEDTMRKGRQAIVLIPEIALTYQTVCRFYERFGEQVAVLHSRLSQGERYDQFELARQGKVQLMIGPRSALFAPFPDLGIIVIDEEHENSYKSETTPRYHAREAAIYRAGLCGAYVVMGSATPSVEAYYAAVRGEYRLVEMPERVEERPLPSVEIVDLREELRKGNRSMFSQVLKEQLEAVLQKGQQALLF